VACGLMGADPRAWQLANWFDHLLDNHSNGN
jgi:hypothetical protein